MNYKAVIVICLMVLPVPLKAEETPVADSKPAVKPAAAIADAEFEDFWSEDTGMPPRLSDEKIDRIIGQIRKTDPARADELMRLKEQDQQRFNTEFRKDVFHYFRHGGQGGESAGPQRPGPQRPAGGPAPKQSVPEGGYWKQRLENMHDEFIGWLEKNYPDKAAELKQLREHDPGSYIVRIGEEMRRYEPLIRAQKNDPKLAAILAEDFQLQARQDSILKDVSVAKDSQKQALLDQLKEVVSRRFDLIMAKKQIQYEHLRTRLEKLRQEVNNRQAELDKLKSNKNKAVSDRIGELIEQTEKIDWQ